MLEKGIAQSGGSLSIAHNCGLELADREMQKLPSRDEAGPRPPRDRPDCRYRPHDARTYRTDERALRRSRSGQGDSTTLRTRWPLPKRGFSRLEAAAYLGISPSKFDELRKAGRIGAAKILDGRKLFAVEMLDEFFDSLPDETGEPAEDWTVRL